MIPQHEEQLISLLQNEIRHTQGLCESLEVESEALIARDMPALEQASADKLVHIRELGSLGQTREALLATIEGDPLNESTQLTPLWQDLLSLAAKCQEMNRINGSIIETGFRQSQQALDILQGTSGKPELYDNSGQTTRSATSSTRVQA